MPGAHAGRPAFVSTTACAGLRGERPSLSPLRARRSRSASRTRLRSSGTPLPPPPTPPSPPLPPPPPPPQSKNTGTQFGSLALLNAVTVLWGSQHAVIKLAVGDAGTSPAALNFGRFLVAALVFAPFLPPLELRKGDRGGLHLPEVWARGLELSLWMFLGYAFQCVGLTETTAARSGFLLYLNVKMVPILARVVYGRIIAPLTWASAALALAGTGLLSYDGSPPNAGDFWSVCAAVASAVFILRMERAAQCSSRPAELNAVSLAGVAVLCGVWALGSPNTSSLLPRDPTAIAAVLYLGIVTTALSNWMQTLGQRQIPAERAAVIFAMDPVYGAAFAFALLGERFGAQGAIGAALITLAAVLSNRATIGTAAENPIAGEPAIMDAKPLESHVSVRDASSANSCEKV